VTQLLAHDPDFTLFSRPAPGPTPPRKRASEHFVNLPRSAAQIGDALGPLGESCVVTAIDADVAVLSQADAPAMDRLVALNCLGH
jgi:hypothetical protein